jgi:hypothetical protein
MKHIRWLFPTNSIAALPFQNLSGDPEQEYLADGVVEDIIIALSRIRWLFVTARNSSFTYKGRAVDGPRAIGSEAARSWHLSRRFPSAGWSVAVPKFSRRKRNLLAAETAGQASTRETSILFLKTHS